MKRLELIERLTGQGLLSGGPIEPIRIGYEILVKQWVIESESLQGASEDRGTYQIQAYIQVPASASRAMVQLLNQDEDADLTLGDGKRARLVISDLGGLLSSTSGERMRCSANHLDGYT
ncbi:MAG: hypothetical protein WAM82_12180 [Thermoanaerobaculia bacterium]